MRLLSRIIESGVENAVSHQVAEYLRNNGFKYDNDRMTPNQTVYVRRPKDPYETKHDEVIIRHVEGQHDTATLHEIHTHHQEPNEGIIEMLSKHIEGPK